MSGFGITIWERWVEHKPGQGAWHHNHFEMGWLPPIVVSPEPKSERQKATWPGLRWRFHHGALIKRPGEIPVVIAYDTKVDL